MSSSSHRQEAEPLIQYSTQQQPDLPQPKTNLSVVRHTHTHTHTPRSANTHTHSADKHTAKVGSTPQPSYTNVALMADWRLNHKSDTSKQRASNKLTARSKILLGENTFTLVDVENHLVNKHIGEAKSRQHKANTPNSPLTVSHTHTHTLANVKHSLTYIHPTHWQTHTLS